MLRALQRTQTQRHTHRHTHGHAQTQIQIQTQTDRHKHTQIFHIKLVDIYDLCRILAFGGEQCQMLRIIQHAGKNCTSHLQGECVVVGQLTNQNAN